MTLSPQAKPMRTRSRSHKTDLDSNGTLIPEQRQPLLDNSTNDKVLSNNNPDTKEDFANSTTTRVNNDTGSPPVVHQKMNKGDTMKSEQMDSVKQQRETLTDSTSDNTIAEDANLKVFDSSEPRKRGRPRKTRATNQAKATVSNDSSALEHANHDANAPVDMSNTVTDDDQPIKEKGLVDSKIDQDIENEESNITNEEEPAKRPGRKRKTTPAKKPSTRAPRNNTADTGAKQSMPIKWTLPHLLHNKDSMLTTATNLKVDAISSKLQSCSILTCIYSTILAWI